MIYTYKGAQYPDYLKGGNAMQFIAPTALKFCFGEGLDVGAGKWPLPGARAIDMQRADDCDAMDLPVHPGAGWDFIFSSHCLEHLENPVAAIEHWRARLRAGGVLFLYLPHSDMEYWRPQHCRKHLHQFEPVRVAQMLIDLGFIDVIHSERDLAWSFAVVGFNGKAAA